MSRETRISLTEDDFKTLVTGGIVKRESGAGPIAICLQDIGYGAMNHIISNAIDDLVHEEKPVFQGK